MRLRHVFTEVRNLTDLPEQADFFFTIHTGLYVAMCHKAAQCHMVRTHAPMDKDVTLRR